jgi:N-acetylglucosaminyldiphosphoundecaprenol N-acetyl-beta-D-mannosaminyltransferase
MIVEASKDVQFSRLVNNATIVLPDGMPVVQSFFYLHKKKQERIAGMDFMPRLLESANEENKQYRVLFYGSTPDILEAVQKQTIEQYKNIIVTGTISPPFRPLEEKEEKMYIDAINDAYPHIVFVSLGCPKQEKWMANNYEKINAVLLGVGGAFNTYANRQSRAPLWMRKNSLEWFYRLLQEPRRLLKRYLVTNSVFILMLVKALIKKHFYGPA